jgi:hypothetical protein
MFGFYLVGYIAVAASFYWRTYKTAPIMEEAERPQLTLWVNPEMEHEQEEPLRKAA